MSDRGFLALSVVLFILSFIFFHLYFSQLRRRSFNFKNKGKRIWGNAPKVHENLNVTRLDTGSKTACPTRMRLSKNTWTSLPISQIAFAVQMVKIDCHGNSFFFCRQIDNHLRGKKHHVSKRAGI
ncbi:TPA: hypothetical protein ACKP12_004995 [Serratia marcescens]|uniref:hypothetical protein n=1 Tax=Serratia ureilytica TaxID=300181 RepID=UPI0018D8F4E1|nr:hypothetical protein [Serratia ureilytica]MBH2928761.1 hypothetical protein [Serratia ureilytica]